MTTSSELIAYGTAYLVSKGVEEAGENCEWILSHCMAVPRLSLRAYPGAAVTPTARSRFEEMLEKKSTREPLSYITGVHDFMGIELRAGPEALIPRPETEELVEKVLEFAPEGGKGPVFADIGTGSGCIAVALAKKMPSASVIATDISEAALKLARLNAANHGLSGRIRFVRCDCFRAVGVKTDVIVSNPPYIPSGDLGKLQKEVTMEPRLALDGGKDGLSVIKRIISGAVRVLKPGGRLWLETGDNQSKEVAGLFDRGIWSAVGAARDCRGIERFVSGRLAFNG